MFLNTDTDHIDEAWKETYIDAFIMSSGVFGGATRALASAIFGNAEGIPSTNGDIFFQPIEAQMAGDVD